MAQLLDLPFDARPDPDEFVRAAMAWHFDPETGSPFWLGRAPSLDFDPRADVKSLADLRLFPNLVDELRDVPVADLIPRGYGPRPDLVGVYESGGTTGPPKRVVVTPDWMARAVAWSSATMDAHGVPRNVGWLGMVPTGPHIAGEFFRRYAVERGGLGFAIDVDPRWVKKLLARGRADEVESYLDHLTEQAVFVLRSQDIGVLSTTPPMLRRLCRDDEVVELIGRKVRAIMWGGAHMDADTRHLYRTEVLPDVTLFGTYGSTLTLGGAGERPGLPDDGPAVFDTFSPYNTFLVVDEDSGEPVAYGERGRVVMNHVSKAMLLPNNLERDLATRVEPPADRAGDSVADVAPVERFEDEDVIEGVY
ncbi:phenazine antibiotic biosynthesis protein [Actinosynnema sp. CS-041913]|uniref:phenazine antibiotic biosynthesis protein n=1 Tax=Actinosynnema sp. CS-041913 TaxID=3239917 RepID=UPI003D8A9571